MVVALDMVINSVIGGFSWVHLIWLANITVWLEPTVQLNPYTIINENKAVNTQIKSGKCLTSSWLHYHFTRSKKPVLKKKGIDHPESKPGLLLVIW